MKHTTADIALVIRDYDEAMWAIASGSKRLNCDHHAMWRTPLIILLTFALLAAPVAVETQSPGDPPWRISLVPWGPTAGQPRPWRHDVRLLDRSAPGHPDDFQVLFANPDSARGGRHEIMWVRVIATDPSTDLFLGILLNEPRFLSSLAGGDNLVFRVPDGNDLPLAIADPT